MQPPIINLKQPFDTAVVICYLLSECGSLSEDEINEILSHDDIAGAFLISEAFSMIEQKDLAKLTDSSYTITPNGKVISDEFIGSIPLSICEKSLAEAKKLTAMRELKKAFSWKIQKADNGFHFCIRFLNEMGGPDILDLKIYAPSYESAINMQDQFLEKPIEVVERIMYMFT